MNLKAHNHRLLQTIRPHLGPADEPCPFVVSEASRYSLTQYRGGNAATFVIVADTLAAEHTDRVSMPTIHLAPHLDSTSLIYDATAGCLQGKARPFACDLTEAGSRIYAVLPYQIEGIAAVVEQTERAVLEVWHIDATEALIPAALPFVLETIDADGNAKSGYRCTNPSGRFHEPLTPTDQKNIQKLTVKSLLTDWQTTIEIP